MDSAPGPVIGPHWPGPFQKPTMKNFITYVGETRQEGRFGLVQKGQVLAMTDREALFVKGDTDFRRSAPKEIAEAEENVSPEERAAAERLIRVEAIRQMSISELREFADHLSQLNQGFNFPPGIDHQSLLKFVLQHERANTANQGDAAVETQEPEEV